MVKVLMKLTAKYMAVKARNKELKREFKSLAKDSNQKIEAWVKRVNLAETELRAIQGKQWEDAVIWKEKAEQNAAEAEKWKAEAQRYLGTVQDLKSQLKMTKK